ncbi:MAG: hypothetical protein HZB13_01410 [Acidobacteria bacterium]|nr:hypothetical protein [Acidobacteriota bacterium]
MSSILPAPYMAPLCLAAYDSQAYGPLFAVSDEGSAGQIVLEAAYSSAKAQALGPLDPLCLGVALDGERMTSAGEVPIGPEEYDALNAVAAGKLMCTTNVGVRVNTRLEQQLPEFRVTAASASDQAWVDSVVAAFAPFLKTPNGLPRPLVVRLSVEQGQDPSVLTAVMERLEAARKEGKIGPANLHRFAALIVFENEITGEDQLSAIEAALEAAARAGLKEVAVDAELREASRRRLGVQSLLNILDTAQLQRLLTAAQKARVRLSYRYQLDVESAARTIWTGLHTARVNGFSAGKYGLFPLTLEEQATAIELITRWTAGWTAIPAFYIDTPLVTATEVYDVSRCEEAAKVWLKMARGCGAKIALFDSPDRVTPRRLVRQSDAKDDPGVLTVDAIERIAAYANEIGVSVLWSGGISSRQAYELARRRLFGIFSTSSTAHKIAVTAQFERDPRMAAENEPTEFGVRRIHALVQGGFLSARLGESDPQLAQSIQNKAGALLDAEQDAARSAVELAGLNADLVQGWRRLHGAGAGSYASAVTGPPEPVPADSVRVFRGRKQPALGRPSLLGQLATVFMPLTGQMQRLYGLTAYLPAVPPANPNSALPDEVALVFYRTKNAYHEAKRCVGGRAYGAMHELVFDMAASKSDFPELFRGALEFDKPYHLFNRSVDWQTGCARLYLGARLPEVKPEAFTAHIAGIATALQRSPGELDAAIFCAAADWLVWWEHSPKPIERDFGFQPVASAAFSSTARMLRMPPSLTRPYAGLSLEEKGDFVNFQFART